MPRLITCLWFPSGQAREAVTFYTTTFPNSHFGHTQSAPADHPGGAAGDDLTIEFTLLGTPFIALNGGPLFTPNESVSFQIITTSQPETDQYWQTLTQNGGSEGRCGWCKDRWGFSWQIVPDRLIDALKSPDPAAAQRVMAALMPMRRIDIATIEAAHANAEHPGN